MDKTLLLLIKILVGCFALFIALSVGVLVIVGYLFLKQWRNDRK